MEFNDRGIDEFAKDMKECLKQLGDKYDIDASFGTIHYDAEEFHFKVSVRQPNIDYDLKNWCQNCWKEGFEAKDYGRLFDYNGTTFKIIGINTRSRKAPILLERISDHNTTFRASSNYVKQGLFEWEKKNGK